MAPIRVLRFGFLLRDRTAAGFMRRVAIARIVERFFADPAGGILLARWGVGTLRRKFTPFLLFFLWGLAVADPLLVVSHSSSVAK